jgi:hypothetical protein
MSYLEIIEKVKRDRQRSHNPTSEPGQTDEINEKDEIGPPLMGAPLAHGATTRGWKMEAPVVENSQAESPVSATSAGGEPPKPTKVAAGEIPVGSPPVENSGISSLPAKPCGACHSQRFWVSIHGATVCAVCHPPASPRLLRQWIDLSDPEMPKQPGSSGEVSGDCPFSLPNGVSLVGYEKKKPPVAITTFSIVNDPEKFIRHALAELDARLHRPLQIRAGDSTFTLLSKLADCGLELRLEWALEGRGLEDKDAQEAN